MRTTAQLRLLCETREVVGRLDVCLSETDARETLRNASRRRLGGVRVISFLNLHALNLALQDSEFRDALIQSDSLFTDGIGLRCVCAALRVPYGLNMNGTDAIPQIIQETSRDDTIALLGTDSSTVERAAALLRSQGFRDVRCADGFREPSEYIRLVREWRPGLTVLGMGMPKQEMLAIALRRACSEMSMVIVNGGAIIDFIAGRATRAPRWMRSMGLEWLHRLGSEPRRLWRRNWSQLRLLRRLLFARLRECVGLLRS